MREWSRKTVLIAAGVAVAVVAVAVGIYVETSKSSTPRLSAADVHAAAVEFGALTSPCPLRFDQAAVAEAGGLNPRLTPALDPNGSAYAEVPEHSAADSAAAEFGMTSIGCLFGTDFGGRPVVLKVLVVATRKQPVLPAIGPVLAQEGEMTRSRLDTWLAAGVPVGQARPGIGSAPIAVGRFDPDGPGEVVVEVAVMGRDGAEPPAGENVQAMAAKLLAQLKV